MTIVLIRAIDFFKIAKASGHSVDDVIKSWDGKEHIMSDDLEDYLRSWSDRIRKEGK